jgi:heme oxygenase
METPLMQHLKEETRSKHSDAEGHPFQGALAQGQLPFESYCRYLVYLYSLHLGFERMLADSAAANPAIASVVKPELYQVPFLKEDLRALKLDMPASPQSPAVDAFLRLPLFDAQPLSLLGVLYVLLGSKHGAKFIAHNVKEAYKLNNGGSLYFDPYGAEFRPLWQNFIAGMNELPLQPAERQAILDASNATFDVFGRMGAEIWDLQESKV